MNTKYKMIASVLAALSIILITSCTSTQKYEEILQTWIGHTDEELIEKWGVPDVVYPTSYGKLLMYRKDKGSSGYGQNLGNMTYVSSTHYYCKTTFTLNNENKITKWSWEGNNCRK